jgi:DNA-binding transcriptional LysR family regulator
MINLRHIEIFHAVYQFGSISAAARALRVSQPSVSKMLHLAEAQFGFPLFRLVKGRLVPTDEAHRLIEHARDVQVRIESFTAMVDSVRRGNEGHVRLAVLHSLGLDVVPRAIALFRRRHPQVSIDIKTVHSEEIPRLLYDRSVDIAVAYDVPARPGLAEIRLGSGELVLLYHRADMPAAPDRVSPEMLAGRTMIRLVDGGAVGTLLNTHLGTEAGGLAEIRVHTYFVAAALVRQRAGMAVVDSFTAQASRLPDLDYRPLLDGLRFEVFGLHLEEAPPSRHARALLTILRQAIADIAL